MLDSAAVVISAICAVHCLALPIVLVAFPILGSTILTDEMFHSFLLWFILPTSIVAVALGRKNHPDKAVILLVGFGLLLILIAAFWAQDHAERWVDTALSVTGGAILAAGHLRNFLICRRQETAA